MDNPEYTYQEYDTGFVLGADGMLRPLTPQEQARYARLLWESMRQLPLDAVDNNGRR